MTEPTRLGMLIPQFPGQTHIFFWREIAELEARGAEVVLFSTRLPPKGLIAHAWSEAAIRRTRYLWPPGAGDVLAALPRLGALRWALADIRREGAGLLTEVLAALAPARRLARICRAEGIGHVHVHSCGRAALIAALAERMGGPSYSLTLHGPMSDYGIGQRLKWRHAAFATVITRKLLAEARAALGPDMPQDVSVRPMGVDTERFRREDAYVPPAPGAPIRIFACGRLNVVKGHQDLLEAVRILAERGVEARLEIAGEDDDGGAGFRAVLEARLAELDLGARARLLGAIDGAAVLAKLRAAHIFVLASWHEPLGVAYMEAMSCAVPTIGTDAGGVRELIEDGVSGVLVPPKSPEALADAIAALAADPDRARALSAGGRARVESAFRASLGAETILAGAARAMARTG